MSATLRLLQYRLIDLFTNSSMLKRAVRVVVPGYADAIRVASRSDLIALAPRWSLARVLDKNDAEEFGVRGFEIPVRMPQITIVAMWYPRVDRDTAQRWLRQQVVGVCRNGYPRG